MNNFNLRFLALLAWALAANVSLWAADPHISWNLALAKPPIAGEVNELVVTARVAPGWIVYSSDFTAEIGPQPTQFALAAGENVELIGGVTPVNPKRRKDKTWDTEFTYFEERAEFRQKIKVLKAPLAPSPTVRIKGQLCNERDGTCTLFAEEVSIVSGPGR